MKYIGDDPKFKGRTALVRKTEYGTILAHFDFPVGTLFDSRGAPFNMNPIGEPTFYEEHPECFGWHAFKEGDFE